MENASRPIESPAAHSEGDRGWTVIVASTIHLDLYLTGYRSIPTIAWPRRLPVVAADRSPRIDLNGGIWHETVASETWSSFLKLVVDRHCCQHLTRSRSVRSAKSIRSESSVVAVSAAYTSEGQGDRGTAQREEVAHCPMRKMTSDESWECRPRASGGRELMTVNSASSGCLEVGLARGRRHPSTFAGSDIRSDGRSGEYKFIVSGHTLPNTKTSATKTTQQINSVNLWKRCQMEGQSTRRDIES